MSSGWFSHLSPCHHPGPKLLRFNVLLSQGRVSVCVPQDSPHGTQAYTGRSKSGHYENIEALWSWSDRWRVDSGPSRETLLLEVSHSGIERWKAWIALLLPFYCWRFSGQLCIIVHFMHIHERNDFQNVCNETGMFCPLVCWFVISDYVTKIAFSQLPVSCHPKVLAFQHR